MACADVVDPRILIFTRAAQEILLEELQVEIGYHVKIRGVEVHVLVEECDHEHAADAVTGLGRAAD